MNTVQKIVINENLLLQMQQNSLMKLIPRDLA